MKVSPHALVDTPLIYIWLVILTLYKRIGNELLANSYRVSTPRKNKYI